MDDKEYYKKLYQQFKNKYGKQPTRKPFIKEFHIDEHKFGKAFGRNSFSKLTKECGDIPKKFSKQRTPLEVILIQWGNLAKELGAIPTINDWAFNNCKPTYTGVERTHELKWSDIPYKFLEYASDKPEWNDIIQLIPQRKEVTTEMPTAIPSNQNPEYYYYLPSIVKDLNELAVSEEKHNEFEKKVNLVFQMLGFEVDEYGQGTGRNPDGIAKDNQNRYAIIIDSKTRSEGFKLGTEDRQIIEYIKKYQDILNRDGFHAIYFLIVSSSFDSASINAINNIKLQTNTETALITANQLLRILAKKIESPRLFNLKEFQKLFIESGVITEDRINRFLSKIK